MLSCPELCSRLQCPVSDWNATTRFCLACLLCLWSTAPALAQEPPAPASPPAAASPAGQTTADDRLPDQISNRCETARRTCGGCSGNVELALPGATFKFFADELDFYLDTKRLVARGNVVFSDAEGRIAADEVEFDAANGTGTFRNASGSMTIGAGHEPGRLRWSGSRRVLPGRDHREDRSQAVPASRAARSRPACSPRLDGRPPARACTINLDDYAFARNMVLKVKGVPVLYLPAIYYPIQDDDRATGFLLPTYGTSTLRGQAVTNGFFWAINRSQDATLVHDWYTQVGPGRRRRVSLRRQRPVAGQRAALWVLAEGNHVHRGRRDHHPAGEQQLPGHRDGQPGASARACAPAPTWTTSPTSSRSSSTTRTSTRPRRAGGPSRAASAATSASPRRACTSSATST